MPVGVITTNRNDTTMTIWELSEKAEYIADRHQQLHNQWQHYCNTLTQAITLSKAKLHHAVGCNPDDDLRFFLFDHFIIRIALAEGFNSQIIEYFVETRAGEQKVLIARAHMEQNGTIDSNIDNRDRNAVLDHYLEKISPVYDSLYRAIHDDVPLRMADLSLPVAHKALA